MDDEALWWTGVLTILLVSVAALFWRGGRRRRSIGGVRRALVVIAHPDDEAMFFGPTICSLTAGGADVHVFCLSAGNFRGQGAERKRELRHSCAVLGVPNEHVLVVEHSRLPDNPRVVWNRCLLGDLILRQLERLGVDTVVSFDGGGVSGHRNHCAIAAALQSLYTKHRLPPGTQVFLLESVNVLRKYSGLLDVLLSGVCSTYCYVVDWRTVRRIQTAMCLHRTQLIWFRRLYIVFSRYMIVNSLRRIAESPRRRPR